MTVTHLTFFNSLFNICSLSLLLIIKQLDGKMGRKDNCWCNTTTNGKFEEYF